jgi:hypothetical protein
MWIVFLTSSIRGATTTNPCEEMLAAAIASLLGFVLTQK